MAPSLTGYVLDPSDSDIVKIVEECAAGRKPEWLRELSVFTDHPTRLFGASKPAVEVRQKHIVLGRIMYADQLERPLPVPGCVYRQSGNTVPIVDEVSGNQTGCFKFFQLWENDHSTPWSLKEFASLSPDLAEYRFAVYVVCFRSDRYVQAEKRMSKAANTMIKSGTPLKQCVTPLSPVTPAASQPVQRNLGLVNAFNSAEVDNSCVRTRSVAREQIISDLITAGELLDSAATRDEPRPLSMVLPNTQSLIGSSSYESETLSNVKVGSSSTEWENGEMVLYQEKLVEDPLAKDPGNVRETSLKGKEVQVGSSSAERENGEDSGNVRETSLKGKEVQVGSSNGEIVLYKEKLVEDPQVQVGSSSAERENGEDSGNVRDKGKQVQVGSSNGEIVLYKEKLVEDPLAKDPGKEIVKVDAKSKSHVADSLRKQLSATQPDNFLWKSYPALLLFAILGFVLGVLIGFTFAAA